jgi:hypothetical protein
MAFVPEGQADRSLAPSAWDNTPHKEPYCRVRCDSCRFARRFDDWVMKISNTKTDYLVLKKYGAHFDEKYFMD